MPEKKDGLASMESEVEQEGQKEMEGAVEVSKEGLAKLTEEVEEGIEAYKDEVRKGGEELLARLEDNNKGEKEIMERGIWNRARDAAGRAKDKVLAIFGGEKDGDVVVSERSEEELAEREDELQLRLNQDVSRGLALNVSRAIKNVGKEGIELDINPNLIQDGLAALYPYTGHRDFKREMKELERIARKEGVELDHEKALQKGLDMTVSSGKNSLARGVLLEAKKGKIEIEIEVKPDSVHKGLKSVAIHDLNWNAAITKALDRFVEFAQENGVEPNINSALRELYGEVLMQIAENEERGDLRKANKLKAKAEILHEYMEKMGIELPLR